MGTVPFNLVDHSSGAFVAGPFDTKRAGDQRVSEQKPITIEVNKTSTAGTGISVVGASFGNPKAGAAYTAWLRGNGISNQFDGLPLDYESPTNKYIVRLGGFDGLILPWSNAFATAKNFTITNGSGGCDLDFAYETDTGDGSTKVFTLASDYAMLAYGDYKVTVNGVTKVKDTDYTLDSNSGKTRVTFVSAPAGAAAIVYSFIPAAGMDIEVYHAPAAIQQTLVTTTETNGVLHHMEVGARSQTFLWSIGTSSTPDTTVTVDAMGE